MALLGLLLAGPALAQGERAPASAIQIVQDVIARLPQDPLLIEGDLIKRKMHGVVLDTLRFEMLLAWGETPSRAQYTIRDSFGADLEQLVLLRDADGALEAHYAAGNPLRPAAPPPLQQRIQNTDLTWEDLTLSFLWWPDARLAGKESVRSRPCNRIDLFAPPTSVATNRPADPPRPYAVVRAWFDEEAAMLLKAEARAATGEPLRTLWVRNFKKTNGRWMIRDLEVQSYPLIHRTRLHVRRFTELNTPATTPP